MLRNKLKKLKKIIAQTKMMWIMFMEKCINNQPKKLFINLQMTK